MVEPGSRAIQRATNQPLVATWFPLPADHLLHLVKENVYRGLFQNKALIENFTIQYRTPDLKSDAFCSHREFPSYTVILPVSPDRSGCLTPTPVQMNIVHSTWINIIPFPTMRENLIKWEFAFDHSEFIRDLVGDLIRLNIFFTPSSTSTPSLVSERMFMPIDDEPTSTQTGLIVWGEPYLADSWEATPDFLHKWAWAATGCQELIDSTNRWRTLRGERPLQLPSAPAVH